MGRTGSLQESFLKHSISKRLIEEARFLIKEYARNRNTVIQGENPTHKGEDEQRVPGQVRAEGKAEEKILEVTETTESLTWPGVLQRSASRVMERSG